MFWLSLFLFSFSALAHDSVDPGGCPPRAKPVVEIARLGPAMKATKEWSLSASAADNARLVKTEPWDFGGPQVGFELYLPLIQKTIGTRSDYTTPEFAHALASWQAANQYSNPDGVLNANAFIFMRTVWYDSRKIDTAFKEQRFVSVSAADRYDGPEVQDKKDEALWKVGEKTYTAYQEMAKAAREAGIDEKELKIASPYRDVARQNHLKKAAGQKKVGYTIANRSVHTSGRALDLYIAGDPMDSKYENRVLQTKTRGYLWLVENAERFGFKNYFFEPWHWEYIGVPETPNL